MQALGSYKGGKMLFLGLGTGLGSAMIVEGIVEPMELGHLPYKKGTYEDYVGMQGLGSVGKKKWRAMSRTWSPVWSPPWNPTTSSWRWQREETEGASPGCRVGDNANAFLGGFRLWEEARRQASHAASDSAAVTQRTERNNE